MPAATLRGRPRPPSLQLANEGRDPNRPRPFWAARTLIGLSTQYLPAPSGGAGRGEWSSGDPSSPALPSMASAPACLQRHSHCSPSLPPGGGPCVRTPPHQASRSPTRNGQTQFVVHPNRRREKSARQGHVSSGKRWSPPNFDGIPFYLLDLCGGSLVLPHKESSGEGVACTATKWDWLGK